MNNEIKLTQRKINALKTKKNLFDSALKLFAEKGYDAVSVDEIATEAGTSKGSFYTYYENKESILIEQFKKIDDYYLKVYKNIKQHKNSASEKLYEFVRKQQLFVEKHMGLGAIKVVYRNQIRNDIKNIFIVDNSRAIYKIVLEIIAEGQSSGEFRNDISAEKLSRIVIRSMRGCLYEWCLYDGNYNLAKDGEWFFSILIDSVLKAN